MPLGRRSITLVTPAPMKESIHTVPFDEMIIAIFEVQKVLVNDHLFGISVSLDPWDQKVLSCSASRLDLKLAQGLLFAPSSSLVGSEATNRGVSDFVP